MRRLKFILILLGGLLVMENCNSSEVTGLTPVIFVSHAGNEKQLTSILNLAESIRTFGGRYKDAPIWIYTFKNIIENNIEIKEKFESLNVNVKYVTVPGEASWFFLSGMVFTSAKAESEAIGVTSILVFVGSDTIIIKEPDEFLLPDSKSLGYRPVTHKNISPLYSEKLDTYWNRAYTLMEIDESSLFKMVTPADNDTLRPYFNASCLAVRPEKGILKKWKEMYLILCQDHILKKESEQNNLKRVFTFQVALIGAILNNLNRDEIIEFSNRYNYPIFFKEMFGSKNDFHDITDVVTIRCERFFDSPIENWENKLKGPLKTISWIKKHYENK